MNVYFTIASQGKSSTLENVVMPGKTLEYLFHWLDFFQQVPIQVSRVGLIKPAEPVFVKLEERS